MLNTRTRQTWRESPAGLNSQISSTSLSIALEAMYIASPPRNEALHVLAQESR
jgi:hypothetical protein